MRSIHRFKNVKYSIVEEKVQSRKLLNLPPGDTLQTRLPMVKVKTANYCDQGHLSRLKKSIQQRKCYFVGCESVTSRLITVQAVGRKIYLLNTAENPAAIIRPINRTILSALALTEINQDGGEPRETRSANPVDRIFQSFDDVFRPEEWNDDVIQVNFIYFSIIAYNSHP